MMRRAVALLAAVLLATAAQASEDQSTIDLDAPAAARWFRTDHYGVFRGEARVGWMRRTLERGTWDETPGVAREIEMLVDIAGNGNRRRSLERSVFSLDGRQLVRSLLAHTEEQGRVVERRVTRSGGRFDVETETNGETISGVTVAIDVALHDELAVERLVREARARPEGAVGAEVVAQGLSLRTMTRTVRRLRIGSASGLDQEDPSAMRIVVTLSEAASEGDVTVDGDGALVEGPLSSGLRLVRMTEAAALDESTLSSVEVATRVPMSARLGDVLALRRLRVRFPAPAAGALVPFAASERQTLSTDEDGVVLSVMVGEPAGVVTDAEREAALAAEEGIDPRDALLLQTATRVLRGTARKAVRAVRLAEFTAQHISDDTVVLGEPSATEILRLRRGDCTEHARLFVALARTAGIPARTVDGLIWMGDDQQTFGWHRWAEVELDGRWRSVDPVGGRLPAHAAHLRVTAGARAAGAFDGLRLELVDVER